MPWEAWTQEAQADYLAKPLPQALPALAADTERGLGNMPGIIACLQKYLPPDAVVTTGAGNFSGWLHRYFRQPGWAKGVKTQLSPAVDAGLSNPDLAALANACGYTGVRIRQTEQFEPELQAALARRRGNIIEIILDPEVLTTRGTLSDLTAA